MNRHNKRLQILMTNDDGVNAPGIRALWQTLKEHADVTVVAPSEEQSAKGMSITLRQPLHVQKVNWGPGSEGVWCINGTPADCVKLALNAIFEKKPDLIVSGINRGSNLGRNILYSGTVGAAIEGVLQEIPSIAFSCQDYSIEPNYQTASLYTPHIISYLLDHPLPEGTLLNVNFPVQKLGKYKGFKMTSQGTNFWAENPDKRTHPAEGNDYYWLGAQLRQGKFTHDSDDEWIKQGYITAVPVHIGNLTDWRHLEEKRERFDELFPQHL